MAYKAFTAFCKGAPDTRISGFEGDLAYFNGDYSSQNDETGTSRKWAKSDGCWMAATASRWEIYKVTALANIQVSSVTYERDRARDEAGVFAWSAGVTGPTVYTDTETPTNNSTICYTNTELTANAATITTYTAEQRIVGAKTEDTTLAEDPMQGTWDLDTLYMEAVPTKELIFKVPEGYEVAIVTIEVYNQADSDGNIYFYRYDSSDNEVFSFALGLKSMETVAMDHKILLPEGFSMYASSTVNGFRICINASQTLVM